MYRSRLLGLAYTRAEGDIMVVIGREHTFALLWALAVPAPGPAWVPGSLLLLGWSAAPGLVLGLAC